MRGARFQDRAKPPGEPVTVTLPTFNSRAVIPPAANPFAIPALN